MANIARLGVVLGLNTAEFQTGLAGAMRGLDKLKTGVLAAGAAVGAASVGIATYTKATIDYMDSFDDFSQKTGIAIESLSALTYAATVTGISQEALEGGLVRLTKGMSDAQQGTGEALKAFEALGISSSELGSADGALMQIAERFGNLEDGAEKTALAIAIFGRSGAQLIPFLNEGRAGIERLKKEAEELNVVVGTEASKASAQFNDNLTRIQAVGRGLFIQIAESWLPTLNNLTEGFINATKQSGSFFASLTATAERAVFGKSSNAVKEIERLQKEINDINKVYPEGSALSRAVWDKSLAYSKSRIAILQTQVNEELNAAFPKELLGYTPPPKPPAPKITSAEKPNNKMANMLAEAQKLSSEYEREREHSLQMLKIRTQMEGLTSNERRVQEAVNEVLDATSKKLQEIADKREAAAGRDASAEILAEYDAQAAAVQELGDSYVELARKQEESSIEAQRTFTYGWNQAFAQYAEDAENYATVGRDMFSAVTGAMSSAIDKFVESGKFSFKDFASSIIKDLIRIQLQAQATALFNAGLKLVMGSIGGSIGGSAGNPLAGDITTMFAGMTGKANGGVINSPTLVGERGAEIFIPGRSGTVIPNNNLRDVMGGGGVTYNGTVIQNMNAIDTQSGLQFLAKNKMNIYALNQSAGRSMPTSR
jgi:lambda family phage tail tape measure protein